MEYLCNLPRVSLGGSVSANSALYASDPEINASRWHIHSWKFFPASTDSTQEKQVVCYWQKDGASILNQLFW